jgi:glycine C-acetyltransferase
MGRVDIVTGTLGKALGGASGGYVAGAGEVVEWLRQKARPYLFSNTLAPVIAAVSLTVLDLVEGSDALRARLRDNAAFFRTEMTRLGFELLPGEHPIIPVMLHEAPLAQEFARRLLDEGVYAIGFFFPVVPQGKARIRTQMSAGHERADLEKAVAAFARVGRALGVIH